MKRLWLIPPPKGFKQKMKKTLLIILPLLLIVGCSQPKPINYEEMLNEKNGVFYTKDTNEPYSGSVFALNWVGENESQGILKNGKPDGLWTYWNRHERIKIEGNWEDGDSTGLWTMYLVTTDDSVSYKIKLKEDTYKEGVSHGKWTRWDYFNEQKSSEGTYKDGKLDGKRTWWNENGQKTYEDIWKDGENISSKCWDDDGNECECGFDGDCK